MSIRNARLITTDRPKVSSPPSFAFEYNEASSKKATTVSTRSSDINVDFFQIRGKFLVGWLKTVGPRMSELHPYAGAAAAAVKNGELSQVASLLASNPELVFERYEHGDTLLMLAAQNGRAAVCQLLLQRGSKAPAIDKSKTNALHWAAKNGHQQIAKMLLEAGVSADAQDERGWTPLHFSCCNGHAEVVEVLLAAGADTSTGNDEGETAMFMAAKNTHKEVLELLMKGGRPEGELDAIYGDKTVIA